MWDTIPSSYGAYLQGFMTVDEYVECIRSIQSHWAWFTWWSGSRIFLEEPCKISYAKNIWKRGTHHVFTRDKAFEERVKQIASQINGAQTVSENDYSYKDVKLSTGVTVRIPDPSTWGSTYPPQNGNDAELALRRRVVLDCADKQKQMLDKNCGRNHGHQ